MTDEDRDLFGEWPGGERVSDLVRVDISPSSLRARYLRLLPRNLVEPFRSALEDPNLTALRAEMALCDARIEDLISRLDVDGGGAAWHLIAPLLRRVAGHVDRMESEKAVALITETLGLVERGAVEDRCWDRIEATAELRRRLSDSETRREQFLDRAITAERALLLMGVLADAVRRTVARHAPEASASIVGDLAKELEVLTVDVSHARARVGPA